MCVGDVVQVHEENLPRGLWKLGRVKELILGSDGNVRSAVVSVVTQGLSTDIRRPIQRLYPLEFSDREVADTLEPRTKPP